MIRMHTASPRHEITEVALHLIAQTRREIGRSPTLPRFGRMRAVGPILHASDSTTVRQEWVILRFVSIAEAFADTLSMELMSTDFPAPSDRLALMIRAFELSSTSTWDKRENAYKEYHGVLLKNFGGYKAIKAAVDVRNSIAHGLGSVTAHQRLDSTLAGRVAPLGIKVASGRMHVSSSTPSVVGDYCASFIRWLDNEC
jgi:hypothetical protein